jgi:hypothetical protein
VDMKLLAELKTIVLPLNLYSEEVLRRYPSL